MTRRKLTKKDFEQMLNEKAESLLSKSPRSLDIDLTGMDDYFEAWKAQRKDSHHYPMGYFIQFGTWLRAKTRDPGDSLSYGLGIPEFDRRYDIWVGTHA